MISEKTKKNLETRYNCHISSNYLCGTYDVFSLDGCHWDWAGTYRGLVSMLGQGQPEENLGQEKKMRAAALFFCCYVHFSEAVLWAKGGNALLTFLVHGLRMDSRMGEVCKPITEPAKGGGRIG